MSKISVKSKKKIETNEETEKVKKIEEIVIKDAPLIIDVEELGLQVANLLVKYQGARMVGKRTVMLPMGAQTRAMSRPWFFGMMMSGAPTVNPTQYSCPTNYIDNPDTCLDYKKVDEM